MNKFVFCLAATVAFPVIGFAMDHDLSVSAGTTGLALHVATPLSDRLSLRVGASLLEHDKSERTRSVDYDFQLRLRTIDLLLDYYPVDQGFRLTSGLMFNGNRIDAAGLPNASGSYMINNRQYSVSEAGRLDGRIDFRHLAPYLGLGWGRAPKAEKRWGVAVDVGAMLQGRPRVALATSGCSLPQPMCAQLAEDINVERASLSDKVDNFRVYPVIRAGVTYRF